MNENPFPAIPTPSDEAHKNRSEREISVLKLNALYAEAEAAFDAGGREVAKPLLPKLYDDFMALNKRSNGDWETQWVWNPDGDLTKEEFDAINLRRKLLSNAVGIMTASGVVRHNLNVI